MKLIELFPEISLNPASSKDIKEWILQLALNGKLTKEFTSKHPNQKNKISLKGYDLPNHWRIDFFKNICDFKMGKTPPSKEQIYWDGKIPWVSIADMEHNGIITETKKTLSDIGFDYSFNKIACRKGTLLMSFKLTIGKTSILGMDACHNEAIISIYPKDNITQRYLFWFLPILSNIGPQVSALMGNTLNKSKLEELAIPIPPLEEQHAIVSIVESLFKEVDELETQAKQRIELKRSYASVALKQLCEVDTAVEWQQIVKVFPEIFNDKQTIKTLRETILQLAVQGKLTAKWRGKSPSLSPASELLEQIKAEKAQLIKEKKIKAEKPLPKIEADEIPFELPEGWVWCRLGEVTDIQRGSSPRPKGDPLYFSVTRTDFHWISIKDISKNSVNNVLLNTEEFLTFEGTKYSRYINKNEILVAVSGSTTGKSCISGINGFIYDGLAVLKQIDEGINHFFLALYMNQMYNQMNNSKFGAAFPNINTNLLNEMIMAFPPKNEQKIIVEKVNALMGLCDELEREVEKLHRLEII